jgi:hypothetical protein
MDSAKAIANWNSEKVRNSFDGALNSDSANIQIAIRIGNQLELWVSVKSMDSFAQINVDVKLKMYINA